MIQDGSQDIPGWELKAFGDCADLIRDSADPTGLDPTTCYIGLEHIEEQTLRLNGCGSAQDVTSNKSRFKKGDILFGKLRPYFRKVIIAPSDGVCSTDIWVVRAKEGIDQHYLYYWMASQQFIDDNMRASEGTKMPRAKWDFASQLERYVPSHPEQHAIARILSSLDDKIELNRKMNATLEAMAQALFKSWFVDFDPVRAKAEGREPTGMDEETTALFPDAFEEVDGKEVPVGWRSEPLGAFIDLDRGLSYKGKYLVDSDAGVPMVNLGTIAPYCGFNDNGLKYYAGDFKDKHTVKPGCIVIANTDMTQKRVVLGSPAIIPDLGSEIIFTHHIYAVRNKSEIPNLFIYYVLQNEDYRNRVKGFATGTTVLALPKDAILDYQTLLPGQEIIDKFYQFSSTIHNKINSNCREINILAALRDTLLPKLISGEVRVPDALLEATAE